MSKLQAALQLAADGFYVFPLAEGNKLPLIKEWQKKATRDREQIIKWWTCPVTNFEKDYNIGICTTYFGDGKALLVIDVDNKDGKNGSESLAMLPDMLPTRTSETPTGGYHYFYVVGEPVSNSVGKLGPGLDVRSRGGYVVAPGSEINGKFYRWLE